MRQQPRTLQIGDNILCSDGEVLGKCKECRADAIQYNDNGDLMCDDCLIEYYSDDE